MIFVTYWKFNSNYRVKLKEKNIKLMSFYIDDIDC